MKHWEDSKPVTRNDGGPDGRYVLNEAKVRIIRARFADGATVPELMREFGLKKGVLQHIKQGITWRHV